MKRWLGGALVVGCVSVAAAVTLSQKTPAIGLSVNDFVARFGTPDEVVKNIDMYSEILRYDPAHNNGLFLRAYFISGQCVAVAGRLASPIPAVEFLPDPIVNRLQRKEYQTIPGEGGGIRLGTEGFDNYWALELSAVHAKSWNPSTQSVVHQAPDPSEESVTAFAYGKKSYFLQILRREPRFNYITSENFFRPGTTLPTDGTNVKP